MSVKVTNEVLSSKLDNLLDIVREHRAEFKEHVKADLDYYKTVDALTQLSANRTWQIRSIWTALVTGAVALVTSHYTK